MKAAWGGWGADVLVAIAPHPPSGVEAALHMNAALQTIDRGDVGTLVGMALGAKPANRRRRSAGITHPYPFFLLCF